MPCEVVKTRGGALAIRDADTGQIMHPGVGPLVEAERLYVQQSRLVERLETSSRPLVVFDVGLGAGSNAIAAWHAAHAASPTAAVLEIVSFERDLSALKLAVDQGEAFGFYGTAAEAARSLLQQGEHDSGRVRWRLVKGDALPNLVGCGALADIIFWDPFSPSANPDLWTVNAFAGARASSDSTATLFTYSASTTVRIALLLAGFAVGEGISVGTKATTTAAAIRMGDLAAPLGERFLGRVARADARMPTDAGPDAVSRVHACEQFRNRPG